MWPIKFRPDFGSIVVKDDLCTAFVYDHAVSGKSAIVLVEVNMTDMRNRPAVRCRQVPVKI